MLRRADDGTAALRADKREERRLPRACVRDLSRFSDPDEGLRGLSRRVYVYVFLQLRGESCFGKLFSRSAR